jgi:hypothetical protein
LMKPLTRNSKPASFTLPGQSHCLCKFSLQNWKFQRIFWWQIFTKLQHHNFIKRIYCQKLAKFLREKKHHFWRKFLSHFNTVFNFGGNFFFGPFCFQVGRFFFLQMWHWY